MCESVGPRGVRVVGSHRAYGIAIGTGARREIIRAADERCEGNLESLNLSDIGEHPESKQREVRRERKIHSQNEGTNIPDSYQKYCFDIFFCFFFLPGPKKMKDTAGRGILVSFFLLFIFSGFVISMRDEIHQF